jgi:hypothetical protein
MTIFRRPLVLLALALLVAPLLASPALAQYREFTGKIDKINSKKVIVDNRMGDKVSFDKLDETTVEGEGKKTWDDLKKGDWVTVSWKFIDKPRKAYKVTVIPPKEDEGEDM